MTDDDVPAVVSLINRAYRGRGAAAGWSTEEAYLDGDRITAPLLRADLVAKPDAALLKWVDADGDMLGCVWLEPRGAETWYLGSLATDPSRQNAGLGRALLRAAENRARKQGARRVAITVINVRESLIAWYGRRGYRPTGETTPFPYGDNRFGTPLRPDLHFVVLERSLDARA